MSYPPSGKIGMSAALALREEMPRALARTHAPCKVLAFTAKVSKRTIEGVKRQEHVISAPALIELAKAYPEVRALVLRLIGETESDPSRALLQIQEILSKVRG